MKRFCYFSLLFILFFSTCKQHSSESHQRLKTKKHINISASISILGNKFAIIKGDTVNVKFTAQNSFDSVKFFVDDSLISVNTKKELILKINTNKLLHFGTTTVKAKLFKDSMSTAVSDAFVLYPATAPLWYTYRVMKAYHHDPLAYTQGLIYKDGILYESTGLKGESSIRKVKLETGEVIQSYTIDPNVFGEGITIWGDKLIQLTWQAHRGFIYDKHSFQKLGEFYYNTEGWGLTNDSRYLIMSDGTNRLFFLNPHTFVVERIVEVFDNKGPVRFLNELEYIDGKVFANIYTKDYIAIINPKSGLVEAYIDLSGLLPASDRTSGVDVLNGIAYDKDNKRLFVTGKNWSKLFWIQLVPKK